MSGPYCPDCGVGMIVEGDQGDACSFCGWEGGKLPYRALEMNSARRVWEAFEEKRQRKEAGELYFFRLFYDAESAEDIVFVLRDLLQVEWIHADRSPILVELTSRPSDETIAKIEALPGVTEVRVH